MEVKKLSQILIVIGGIITGIALIWWAAFYGEVAQEFGGNLGDALKCLFSSGGECAFVTGIAQMVGSTPYNPVVFWVGIVILGVGLILLFSLKQESSPQTSSLQHSNTLSSEFSPTEYAQQSITNKELEELKRLAGEDAVTFAYATQTEWICVCGEHNPLDKGKQVQNCSNCHRNRNFVLEKYRKKDS